MSDGVTSVSGYIEQLRLDTPGFAPVTCSGCGDEVTSRYLPYDVCQNCYQTDDDPWQKDRG